MKPNLTNYIEKQKAENRQNVTLEELYAEWLLYKRDYTSVKAKTIQEYVSEWNRFFKDTELVICLSVLEKQKLSVGKILTTITGLYIFTDRRPVNVH